MIYSINKYITISIISILYGCNSFPYNGNIKDAYIFHWEHDYVVMSKFIEDHKNCLGVKEPNIGSQAGNIFNNMKPKTIPKWDSLWATFESRSAFIHCSFFIECGSVSPNVCHRSRIDRKTSRNANHHSPSRTPIT